MGQQPSVAWNFCCTACSACPCCGTNQYTQLEKVGLMNDPNQMNQPQNYQSNELTKKMDEHKIDKNIDIHRDIKTKFRAFIIGYHKEFGYLLLRAYKKGKGTHYQLPGGHIDKSEFHACSLEEAAKNAAKRELFEETGLEISDDGRLKF
eukprot:406662_1